MSSKLILETGGLIHQKINYRHPSKVTPTGCWTILTLLGAEKHMYINYFLLYNWAPRSNGAPTVQVQLKITILGANYCFEL